MKPGMSTSTGHPATHGILGQSRQREASTNACSSVMRSGTSLKFFRPSFGSCSGIFCRGIFMRSLAGSLSATGFSVCIPEGLLQSACSIVLHHYFASAWILKLLDRLGQFAARILKESLHRFPFLLFVGAQPKCEQVEIDFMSVEIRSVDAGESGLAAYADPAATAHPCSVNHKRIERKPCREIVGSGQIANN